MSVAALVAAVRGNVAVHILNKTLRIFINCQHALTENVQNTSLRVSPMSTQDVHCIAARWDYVTEGNSGVHPLPGMYYNCGEGGWKYAWKHLLHNAQ